MRMEALNQVGHIPSPAWAMIEERGIAVTFEAGESILHHGATGRSWFAIVSGTVLVTVASTQGATLVLGRRVGGELVGELAALESAPRAATASAKDEVSALKLQPEDLDAILHANPDWAITMLRHLAGELRSMSYRYMLRSEDLRARVSALLLTHLEETGEPAFRSTREEFSGWVGATREATSRMLTTMQGEGILRLSRGSVEVLDVEQLISEVSDRDHRTSTELPSR